MPQFVKKNQRFTEKDGYQWVVLSCVFLFFATAMTVKSSSTIFLGLIFLLGLPLMKVVDYKQWWLMFALSLPFGLATIQYLTGLTLKVNSLDAPSRFLIAGLCIFPLAQSDKKRLSLACYGCILGTFGVAIWSYVTTHIPAYYWLDCKRATNNFSNPIAFSTISLLLGFISLTLPTGVCSKNKRKKTHLLILMVKSLAFVSGIIAGYLSGSRTVLLIFIPLLFVLLIGLNRFSLSKIITICIVTILLMSVAVFSTNNKLHDRVNDGIAEISGVQENKDSSIRLRVMMWKTTLDLIKEHPFSGLGRGNLKYEVAKIVEGENKRGIPSVFSHPHNELLSMTVDAGIPGLIVGLILYFLPGLFFATHIRSQDHYTRFAATAGCLVVVGFFFAGLMDSYFWIVSQTAFYGLSVTIFSAIILAKRKLENIAD